MLSTCQTNMPEFHEWSPAGNHFPGLLFIRLFLEAATLYRRDRPTLFGQWITALDITVTRRRDRWRDPQRDEIAAFGHIHCHANQQMEQIPVADEMVRSAGETITASWIALSAKPPPPDQLQRPCRAAQAPPENYRRGCSGAWARQFLGLSIHRDHQNIGQVDNNPSSRWTVV